LLVEGPSVMATSILPGIMSPDKVVIIGAGMGGIAMGAQLKRLLHHENFEIYEKFNDVGGTWAQNTYPNLNCDIPSDVGRL
jgi:cation diffusion facilitator CzcD-associated flavoprotein CzcO